MLEIVQAKDFTKYYGLFEELGISGEIVSVAEALDKNEVIGCGIYHYADESVIIDYVGSENDKYLYDGIVRSILYLALTNNIDKAEFKVSDTKNLKELGFIKSDSIYLESITDFMDNCKNCKVNS